MKEKGVNPGYYVFYGPMNEHPWTIVILTPSRIGKGQKWYQIGGARKTATAFEFKHGYLPYRIDRKNRHLLGERVEVNDIPAEVMAFIRTICANVA